MGLPACFGLWMSAPSFPAGRAVPVAADCSNNLRPCLAGCLLFLIGLFISVPGRAEVVAVLFPDVREPFRKVFVSIIEGIRAHPGLDARTLALTPGTDQAAVQAFIRRERVQAVIALGKRAYLAANAVLDDGDLPLVLGALLLPPGSRDATGMTGVSLAVDPYPLFETLRQLSPAMETVHVVYSEDSLSWLVERAQEAAQLNGLKLVRHGVRSRREGARMYRKVLKSIDGRKEALWLPPDAKSLDERAVLPLLLREAWRSSFVVFSSNPVHAKRGALFALFPDNRQMGAELGELVIACLRQSHQRCPQGVRLTQALQSAVNTRTAEHVGVTLNNGERFSLKFPVR